MSNLNRSVFQGHPFHLVSPSPWPVLTSLSLFILPCCGVLTMHNFSFAGYWLTAAFILLISSMSLWFRDVISEGTATSTLLYFIFLSTLYTVLPYVENKGQQVIKNSVLKIAKAISPETVEQCLSNFINQPYNNAINYYKDKKEFGYYLAGLLEGDGHISLPSLGITTLNRVLNPRIVFTSHINNLALYGYIQKQLGGIGRFQLVGDKSIRYIIGDVKGIILLINLISGKLRTPKNNRLNDLIKFINEKYSLTLTDSKLDLSNINSNPWFAGFAEADGHFGVKIIKAKLMSDKIKKSVNFNTSLKFRLDQRSYDKPNKVSMLDFMQKIAIFLSCEVKSYIVKPNLTEILSVSVQSIDKVGFLVNYFNTYPLIGVKAKDFNSWQKVYNLIISKEHLTDKGKLNIILIANSMKENKT